MFEGNFVNDSPDGKVKMYYANGDLEYEGLMSAGCKEGAGILYDENCKKIFKGTFKEDKYHGNTCFLYHSNKKMAYSGGFKNNMKSGKAKDWYNTGV